MEITLIIWAIALFNYLLFSLWYFGVRKALNREEIDEYLLRLQQYNSYKEKDLSGMRSFLENDDGKSFAMVNSILLKDKPDLVEGVNEEDKSLQVLIKYHKSFMKMMIPPTLSLRVYQALHFFDFSPFVTMEKKHTQQYCLN